MIVRAKEMSAGLTMSVDVADQPTASAAYVRAVVEFAELRGAPRHAVLTRAGLLPRDLSVDEARLPLSALIAVFRTARTILGDAAFALRFGAHVPCNHVSLAATMGQSASTVSDAMTQLNRYARLGLDFPILGSGDRFRFVREGATVSIVDLRPVDAWPEITEVVFARMALGVRRAAGRDVLRAVHVTHAQPSHHDAYVEHFGVPVRFGSDRNALAVDAEFLATSLTPTPPLVMRIVAAEADAQLRALDRQRSCRGRVQGVLRGMLARGDVRVERVASALAMSRQTLYRRLKAEGVTFEAVLDDTRRTIVFELMRSAAPPVRVLADAAGFADAAAFTRAFKRWTGRTPGDMLRDASRRTTAAAVAPASMPHPG